MSKFNIGDRVVCIGGMYDGNTSIHTGMVGTVCDHDGKSAGIAFDSCIEGGHTCSGNCRDHHGWYINEYELALYDDGIELDIDESALNGFIYSMFCPA